MEESISFIVPDDTFLMMFDISDIRIMKKGLDGEITEKRSSSLEEAKEIMYPKDIEVS